MHVRIGGERLFEGVDGTRKVALRCLQNADVRGDSWVIRLEPPRFGERLFGAGEVVAPAEAGGEPEIHVRRGQRRGGGGFERRLGARTIPALKPHVTKL